MKRLVAAFVLALAACGGESLDVDPIARSVTTYPTGFGPCLFGASVGASQVMLFSGAAFTGSCALGQTQPNGIAAASLGDFGPNALGVRSLKQSLTTQGYTNLYRDPFYNLVWVSWCGCYLPSGAPTEYLAGTGNGVQGQANLLFLPSSLVSAF